ncbi:11743_t:CDS:2, partial [Racocetra persica]
SNTGLTLQQVIDDIMTPEDPAPKRLVETRRISDQDLCINHLAIIPETYLYQEDPLVMFENVEDQISDVYRRKLAQLEGGHFGHRIDQDIAFPSKILDIIRQDRIDQTVSRIINPQNTDERCFEAYIKAYLASEEACRQGQKARNLHDISRLQRFNNILDFSDINFPSTLHDINIFEENNLNYTVNIFYPAPEKNDKEQATRKLDLLCLSEYNYQREYMVDLILFTEGEEDLRDRHRNNLNAGQKEIFLEKDLEADSDPVENNIINEKTVKLQKQKPNSYGYTLIQTDGKLAKEIVRRTLNSIAES